MGRSDEQTLTAIETQVAVLMRHAESPRRPGHPAPHGALDRAAYLLLHRLDEAGPQSVTALAMALALDVSTVTRQVSALEAAGLVVRSRDGDDGQATLVAPTRSGLNRLTVARRARTELYSEILADWPTEDRQKLADLLGRLNHAIDTHNRQRPVR